MRTIGFVISKKENEHRRALLPCDVKSIKNKEHVYIEKGYGSIWGYDDSCYLNGGIGGVCDRTEILKKDVICDPKVGDAEYLNELSGQIVFGWLHAVQNRDITDRVIASKLSAYAWEDMYEMGRHSFWRNNEIAGEAAIMHAYLRHGIFPYHTRVAVIGRGNVARGAMNMLNYMGAMVTVYDRKTEALFRKELPLYDVVVNGVLWDISRKDHIISREDLKRMKPGAMIIDISCDRGGGIETSVPMTIDNPDYEIDGIRHYVVDHTPALFYKTVSKELSKEVVKYIDYFIEERELECEVLKNSLIIEQGVIRDERINSFQNRQVLK